MLDRYLIDAKAIASAEFASECLEYRANRCFLRLDARPERFSPECSGAATSHSPLMFLWGDSHAAALYSGLSKLLAEQNNPPPSRAVHGGPLPALSEQPGAQQLDLHVHNCRCSE
jgi:hypothetical protein